MSWQYYNMGVLCYCNITLLGYYVTMLLCYCNIMLLGYYVAMLLCYCNIMLLGYYVVMLLCYCNVMLLGYYVVILLCYYNVMLLGHHVVVLLCYQGITLLQYYNRVYFIYTLIINILQSSLSSAYNFTITIYILLYDTDWYVISVNQDAIVQYSIKTFNIEYLNFGKWLNIRHSIHTIFNSAYMFVTNKLIFTFFIRQIWRYFIAINGHGATIHFKWILCSNEQSKLCFCPTESILPYKNQLALSNGRGIFLQSRIYNNCFYRYYEPLDVQKV